MNFTSIGYQQSKRFKAFEVAADGGLMGAFERGGDVIDGPGAGARSEQIADGAELVGDGLGPGYLRLRNVDCGLRNVGALIHTLEHGMYS